MRKLLLLLAATGLLHCVDLAAQVPEPVQVHGKANSVQFSQLWRQKLRDEMPLLGHRNWILVVDSAYPLQTSPGVEVIETGQSQLEVTHALLEQINTSIHVRPIIYMDAELPFVPESDAPGVSHYRSAVAATLQGLSIQSLPHEKILANIAEESKSFHVLVLKTNMTIPYTSIFVRLDCKYWSADAEKRLRDRISAAASH